MIANLTVGVQSAADGVPVPQRAGKQGDSIVTECHGRYFEQVYRGKSFLASTQAAVALTAGLSATALFGLRNPAGSGKILVINSVQASFSAAPAAAVVLLHTAQTNVLLAVPTAVTALTSQAGILGQTATAVGVPFSAATLAAAPVVVRIGPSILAVASITPPFMNDEIAGAICIYPGAIYSLQASAAASAFCSISWEEIDV